MVVGKFVETFKDFPIIQKPNTFTIGDAMEAHERGVHRTSVTI